MTLIFPRVNRQAIGHRVSPQEAGPRIYAARQLRIGLAGCRLPMLSQGASIGCTAIGQLRLSPPSLLSQTAGRRVYAHISCPAR